MGPEKKGYERKGRKTGRDKKSRGGGSALAAGVPSHPRPAGDLAAAPAGALPRSLASLLDKAGYTTVVAGVQRAVTWVPGWGLLPGVAGTRLQPGGQSVPRCAGWRL